MLKWINSNRRKLVLTAAVAAGAAYFFSNYWAEESDEEDHDQQQQQQLQQATHAVLDRRFQILLSGCSRAGQTLSVEKMPQVRELCDGRFETHIKTVISYIKTAVDRERKLELWRQLRQALVTRFLHMSTTVAASDVIYRAVCAVHQIRIGIINTDLPRNVFEDVSNHVHASVIACVSSKSFADAVAKCTEHCLEVPFEQKMVAQQWYASLLTCVDSSCCVVLDQFYESLRSCRSSMQPDAVAILDIVEEVMMSVEVLEVVRSSATGIAQSMCDAVTTLLSQQLLSSGSSSHPDLSTHNLSHFLGQLRAALSQVPASVAPDLHVHAAAAPQLDQLWRSMMADAQGSIELAGVRR